MLEPKDGNVGSASGFGMQGPLVGLCTDRLELARSAGFDFAECGIRRLAALSDEEFAAYAARHRTTGLPTPVGNVFLPPEISVVGANVQHDAQMRYVERAFLRARQLGVAMVVFGSASSRQVPDGFATELAFQQLVDFARRVSLVAERSGIIVAAEPITRRETNTINNLREGLDWVRAVGHPNFQLMVDYSHMVAEREDLSRLAESAGVLKHVHIANPRNRSFPRDDDGCDYRPFLQMLREIGYRGRISIEGKPKNLDADAPQAIALIRRLSSKDAVAEA